ncbi:hypothetical protein [Rubritalea tangerina]|uniref:hypothetical protein n=1 Tax=Rubritalea tangerina TaxID=430798 RepID=UPI003623002F
MTFCKIIRFTLKSRSANFTRLSHTPFDYSESRDGITRFKFPPTHFPAKVPTVPISRSLP